MNKIQKFNLLKEQYSNNIDKDEIKKNLKLSHATYYRWVKKLENQNDLSNNDILKSDKYLDISNNLLNENSIIKNIRLKKSNKNYSNKQLFKMILSNNKQEIKEVLNIIIKYIDSLEDNYIKK